MQDTTIKTRPDGSIDTAYYMAKGRLERSRTAHELARKVKNAPAEVTAGTANRLFTWFLGRTTLALSGEKKLARWTLRVPLGLMSDRFKRDAAIGRSWLSVC